MEYLATTSSRVSSLVVADFDGMPGLDVAGSLRSDFPPEGEIVVWGGNADGTLGLPRFIQMAGRSLDLASTDVNGDGRNDLLGVASQNPNLTIRLNRCDPDPAPVSGDVDGDGFVGFSDLTLILNDFGQVNGSLDLNGDGIVGLFEIFQVLINWNPPPSTP